jgi:ABC-type transporter MlaC component
MVRVVSTVCVAVMLWVVPIAGNAVAQKTAGARVEMFHRDILNVMKQAENMAIEERYRILKPILSEHVHLGAMMATATAPYWRRGTPEHRQRVLRAFQHMGSSLLATIVTGYSDEIFKVVRERNSGNPVVLIDSQIISSGDATDVSYVLAKVRNRWWVIDIIIAGGISEVKVLRAEYRKILGEGGLAMLATILRKKGDQILAGNKKVANSDTK